jgi:DNA adenine methylase
MTDKIAKPFLKWAGGKTQLINDIERLCQKTFSKTNLHTLNHLLEAVQFFLDINNFPKLEKAVINDINEDLINTYKTIASRPKELISILEILQNEFHNLEGNEDDNKKLYYYQKRELYNTRKEEQSGQAALFIFLNRTCFNGLYRVNSKNLYNVPMGGYKKPTICDKENILAVSNALQKVEILCGDFEQTLNYATNNSLFYFDPPYKPLSETSSFNSYAKDDFNDNEQIRLRDFCSNLIF